MMPFGFKNNDQNKNKDENNIENTPINTTTKLMNGEKEKKTYTLTPLHRKTEESIFKMEEPAQISYSLFRDEHNEKMFNIGSEAVILGAVLYVGASAADAAGNSIVTKVLAYVSLLSLLVGISVSLIALFRELRT